MIITVGAELSNGRSGVEARVPALQMASRGTDHQDAIETLTNGIAAWCRGLMLIGELDVALKRRHIQWEPDGNDITVVILDGE